MGKPIGLRIATLSIAAALAALAIAGCGDGEEEGNGGGSETAAANSEAPPGPSGSDSGEGGGEGPGDSGEGSKAQFILKGEAICAQTIENVLRQAQGPLKEQERTGEPTRREVEIQLVEDVFLPELENEVEEFEALDPPAGDEQAVERLIASFERVVEEVQAEPRILAGTGSSQAFEGAERVAEDYGLEKCPYG